MPDTPDEKAAAARLQPRNDPCSRNGGSAPPPPPSDRNDLRLGLVRQIVARRSVRAQFLDSDLFGEPGWDMLLDLYVALRRGRRLSVTALCLSAGVPNSTALRWVRELTTRGLIERAPDPDDGRRTFLALSDRALAALETYLDANLPKVA